MIELSIVFCMFNEELNIQKSLESMLQQFTCFSSAELLVIDNSSTDASYIIAENVLNNCELPMGGAKLFRIKHCSLSNSRNFAIENARGKYIFFIDADSKVDQNWYLEIDQTLRKCDPNKNYIFSGYVGNLEPSLLSTRFYESVVMPKRLRGMQSPLPLIGANMGFSKCLFNEIMFYDGFSRGDESALKAALDKLNVEYEHKSCHRAIVYNSFPNDIKGWMKLFFNEGYNRQKIDVMITQSTHPLTFILKTSILIAILTLIFLMVINIPYQFSAFSLALLLIYKKFYSRVSPEMMFYRLLRYFGKLVWVVKTVIGKTQADLVQEKGEQITKKIYSIN